MAAISPRFDPGIAIWSYWVERYVDLGWVLVPVVPGEKGPYKVLLNEIYGDSRITVFEEAPPLYVEVEHWFARDPHINLAVMPCARSRLVVADIDVIDFDPRLATPTVISGRPGGGKHLYFVYDQPIPQTKMPWGHINPQIAVLPGSLHWTGTRYRWSEGFSPDDLPFMRLEDAAGALGIEDLL